jgi:tetratricopeptide (TPR) repeat protein
MDSGPCGVRKDRMNRQTTRVLAIPAWAWALLAAGAALLVFLPALRFPFFPFWDDDIHVHANPHLVDLSWGSTGALWSRPWQQLYIPLTYTAWAGLAALSRWSDGLPAAGGALNAAWFHGANILLHAASAALVFVLLRRVVAAFRGGAPHGKTDAAAALGALVFALHPLQVEPVAWISGLRDVLGGFLGLAALVVMFGSERFSAARWIWATVLFVASLAAKPAGVALPLMAGVLAFAPFRWSWRQMATGLGPWLLMGAAWVAVTTRAQWAAELAAGLVPLWARPLVALDALAFYLGKTFVPLGLAADYGRAPDTALAAGWLWWTWLGPVVLAAVLIVVRPLRIYLVPFAIFAAALLPTLGLVPFNFQLVSTVADRYAYLALLGPALAVALAVGQVGRVWFTTAVTVGVAALAWSSVQRLPLWSEDLKLFADTLEVNPGSWKARHNYASALDDRGRTAEAVPLMREVLVQRPDSAEAHNDLAVMLWTLGQRGEAVVLMRQAVNLRPTPGSARNLAIMEEVTGDARGHDDALRILRELGEAP